MMRIKIPQLREKRKPKLSIIYPGLSDKLKTENDIYDYTTISYLQSIGVPIRNLKDPVLIKRLPFDQFIIVNTNGKEISHST